MLFQAALTIQSALRGHKARRKQLRNYESDEEEEEEDEEEDLDEAATMIQSSYRGHRNRKDQLKSYKERYKNTCDIISPPPPAHHSHSSLHF